MSKVVEAMAVKNVSLDSVIVVNPATTEQIAKQACQNGEFTIHGTIVARGLRGEDIERKLAEIFANE